MDSRRTTAEPGGPPRAGTDHAPSTAGRSRAATAAGVLLVVAGTTVVLGITTAEAYFPASISTSQTTVSALASTWDPGGVVHQPSAAVFTTTMLVTGALVLTSAALLYRATRRPSVAGALAVLGLGVLLVGVFPGGMVDGEPVTSGVHPVVSLVAFVGGAAAALLSSRVVHGPFRYVCAGLGLIATTALVLQGPLSDTGLGDGGLERWIIYPVVLWLVAFGSHLLAAAPERDEAAHADRPLPHEGSARR